MGKKNSITLADFVSDLNIVCNGDSSMNRNQA